MKINLAIVEDDDKEYTALIAAVERFGSENGVAFSYDRFKTADVMLSAYKPVYDIVFMDIGLPGTNGLEASKRLRERDKNVMIIFVTSLAQFAVNGYEVGAFDFILKPVMYGNIKLKLLRAMERIAASVDLKIKVQSSDGLRIVSVSDIKYVEVMNRSIIYHTNSGDIRSYGALKNVETQLPKKQFARCNNCYLVNLDYVTSVKDYTAVVGGEELKISHSKKKEFLQALGARMEGK